MKVLLVNPYFGNLVYAPTLGLAYLATYIKEQSGCEVEVHEPVNNFLNERELLEKVKQADYLGLVCYTESRFLCFDFAEKAKKANPHCKIVVGGTHATVLDKEILKHYQFIDYVVRMEGETALLAVIKGEPLDQIPNLTWRSGDNIVRNPDKCLRGTIDQFHIDYSLIW
ncbi:MAG: cobalamin-dependent protein, partial [Candidatus Margulisbacteria bacterium]|nr:cobalamin-dependent protein [Candidatus Margulisiibacteriota bacterium]